MSIIRIGRKKIPKKTNSQNGWIIFPLFQNRGAVAVGAGSSTSCCVLLAAAAAAAQRPPFPMDVSTETPIWVWIALLFDSSLFTSKI